MALSPRLPIALCLLFHSPARLVVSIAGVMLAIVLMFSQAGFRNGMFDSQTEFIKRTQGDLFIVGRLKYLVTVCEPFSKRRLLQAQACPGVQAVYPLYLETVRGIWKNPNDGSTRTIRVLAFDLDDPVFTFPGLADHLKDLRVANTVLFDEKSRDYYGRPQAGTWTELAGHNVKVVGTFQLGTDFTCDGNVIMSDRTFQKVFPDPTSLSPLDKVEIGVVKVEPGANLYTVRETLREQLPTDVLTLTKQEFVELELQYWRRNSPVGYIFTLGMGVGFVIGVIICYQILHSNVSSYLPQFATLKAMGFTNRYLVGIVLQQGVLLALLGFLPAVGAAQLLFWVVSELTGLVMILTPFRIGFILILAVAMCVVSGLIAIRGVLTADPAEVFR